MIEQILQSIPTAPSESTQSESLLRRARESVAGGASSTMRVLPYHLPLVIERAEGALIRDADGNELIDFNMGYGPLIFGHRSPLIVQAIERELRQRGALLGFPHELSHQVAERVKESFPSIDLLRFTSTGTEAGQTAARLARAFTGRSHLVLFEGHYHGSSEAVFHRYHAPVQALEEREDMQALPGTKGMAGSLDQTYVIPWNDAEGLARVLEDKGATIAAVMMEPVMGNAGVIPPKPGFLETARALTRKYGALLVFDEVITGFRIARGGAQERYGVTADITMLSKALGGGVPIGAVGGRRDVLQLIVNGDVFHGGVYSANPLSLAAALAVQNEYERVGPTLFEGLERSAARLARGLREVFAECGVPVAVQHAGPMFSCWFLKADANQAPADYRQAAQHSESEKYIRFQHAMQKAGVYFHPNRYEPWYLSTAHTDGIIDRALDTFRKVGHEFDWGG